MTCCVLGDQDAILGHVASRGDRISPSQRIETPSGLAVNRRMAEARHEEFTVRLEPRPSAEGLWIASPQELRQGDALHAKSNQLRIVNHVSVQQR